MKNFFYNLLYRYISVYVLQENSVVEINPQNNLLISKFKKGRVLFLDEKKNQDFPNDIKQLHSLDELKEEKPEYILLNGNIHYEKDIQRFLSKLKDYCTPSTRIITVYYSQLWSPVTKIATFFKLRSRLSETNWVSPEDLKNFLILSDFELIRSESRILMPFNIPGVSSFINRYLAVLPGFQAFNFINIAIARPLFQEVQDKKASVSVVVAARNEAGNIENLINRIPKMGPDDELIIVEGNSTDDTWEVIQKLLKKYEQTKNIIIAQQDGKGKGDAVRKGFNLASKDILMILDADLTVHPEDLPLFYNAIVKNKGEYINGSRLVYPMRKESMRFFNIVGNKFFAKAFSFVLGQQFKDTLCGTKVISRKNYQKLAQHRSYFGDFDPFGDFDLIFGTARLGLKIIELPITYDERTYGTTNISRWSHGVLLFRMLIFAARKIKFI